MYNQTRSLNLGIAVSLGVEAAFIYDDLAFAQHTVGKHDIWFYRSYEHLMNRLPIMSESTMRRAIRKLEDSGWIRTKVKKVDGTPRLHFQIARTLSVALTETLEPVALTETSIYKTTKQTTKSVANATNAPKQKEKELISLVNKVTGRAFRTLPNKGVKKLLDTFTLVEIHSALAALAADDWHRERIKELSLDYLIRPTTIDKFLQISSTKNNGVTVENQDQKVEDWGKRHGII